MGNAVYIHSLAPYEVIRKKFRWAPLYKVAAAPKGGYSTVRVVDGADSLYIGEGRSTPIAVQARAVAQDIVRDVEDHGCFISENEIPTAAELDEADKRRRRFYQKTIDEADSSWRTFGKREFIPAHAQFAADFLGIKRDWHSDLTELVDCPGCQTRILPGIARCPSCRAVLDHKKAYDLLMLTPDEIKMAVAAGRLTLPETTTKTTAKSAVA